MRIGYGYNRRDADFASLDCDRLYIDLPGTDRQERGAMMIHGALRSEDVIVVLDAGDVGVAATAAIQRFGVSIEVNAPDGPLPMPGAPAKFVPTDEQDANIKALWFNPGYKPSYIMLRVREIMGWDVQRHHMTHRYGNRHQR